MAELSAYEVELRAVLGGDGFTVSFPVQTPSSALERAVLDAAEAVFGDVQDGCTFVEGDEGELRKLKEEYQQRLYDSVGVKFNIAIYAVIEKKI